jgi:hypothetical protein
MVDILIPIPKTSLEKLLKPINRASDSCVLKTNDECLYTVCTSDDKSVIIYGTCKIPTKVENLKLNVISIKKLLTGLDCLGDNGEFSMILKKNHLRCQMKSTCDTDNTFFKYHLVDDGIITESSVSIDLIAKLSFDIEFEISVQKLKQIMSAYMFVGDAIKIYFYTKDKSVYADIDDKTISNIDNISFMVSDSFVGLELDRFVPIKLEVFKNLISSKSPVKVKINKSQGVLILSTTEHDGVELKYIVSALVK